MCIHARFLFSTRNSLEMQARNTAFAHLEIKKKRRLKLLSTPRWSDVRLQAWFSTWCGGCLSTPWLEYRDLTLERAPQQLLSWNQKMLETIPASSWKPTKGNSSLFPCFLGSFPRHHEGRAARLARSQYNLSPFSLSALYEQYKLTVSSVLKLNACEGACYRGRASRVTISDVKTWEIRLPRSDLGCRKKMERILYERNVVTWV